MDLGPAKRGDFVSDHGETAGARGLLPEAGESGGFLDGVSAIVGMAG